MPETATLRLSNRQQELLKRVCLKRYTVVFEGYMGSWRPSESVHVTERDVPLEDRTFRASTLHALADKGLVTIGRAPLGRDNSSEVKPTVAGLELYKATRSG